MTPPPPPPAESVAAMMRPAPPFKDSQVNRDLLRVMEGVSPGYLALLATTLLFMHIAGGKLPVFTGFIEAR